MQIKNIMTKDVTTITPDTTVEEAARLMKDLNVGAIPVCEGTKPVGIITDRDITLRSVADKENTNIPVKTIMSQSLISGSPEMTYEEASKIMAENQIRRLPIVENGNLIGIVALGDLAVQSGTDVEIGETLSSISYPSKPQK